MKRFTAGWAVVFALFIAARFAAASASPEELQKQTEFKKAYASPDKADHLKAVACLEGCTHDSSRQLLVTVVNVDQYKEVQIEAFKMLAQFPARDLSLSTLLVSLFNNLKLTDIETRTSFVEAMKLSEFKYQLIEAAADFGSKLRYPDLVTNTDNGRNISVGGGGGGGNGASGGDPNVLRKKQRAEFEKYLAAFNTLTKANLTAADREAPAGMRKWLTGTRQALMNADKEAVDKYRKEDQEKLNKNNPLLPNKEKKEEKADEKKDEKKDDKKDEKKDDEKKEEKRDLVKDALEKKDAKKGEKKKAGDE